MPDAVEREIKLSYDSPAVARRAVVEAGATPLRARRLQNDYLLDRETAPLGDRQCTLRVRVDDDRAYVTFKGAPGPGRMKVRDELETTVGDGELLLRLFERLGFRIWFRYQKYREEFRCGDLVIAVDESPIGTFVELEGSEEDILAMATTLERPTSDFVLDSYVALFRKHRAAQGSTATDMLFEDP
ncbi:MAG: CYTH domain-containing protein [Acidobacteria bacterium]|jgi:adenylate cyclase class 2|nr:class IV adenylate cyclase [Acidobacteriota bacterium]TDI23447.1 MAG: CYTH domain-containing protein [Acidobacteriota bacterium]